MWIKQIYFDRGFNFPSDPSPFSLTNEDPALPTLAENNSILI